MDGVINQEERGLYVAMYSDFSKDAEIWIFMRNCSISKSPPGITKMHVRLLVCDRSLAKCELLVLLFTVKQKYKHQHWGSSHSQLGAEQLKSSLKGADAKFGFSSQILLLLSLTLSPIMGPS